MARSPLLKPLTRKRVRRETKAAGRLATQGERRDLLAERRTSKVQSRRIKDYFKEYKGDVEQAGNRSAAAYAGASDKISSQATTAAGYAESLRQKLDAEARADAERRGTTYDGSGGQTNVAAQSARINSANVLAGVTAAQGASQSSYFSDKARQATAEKKEQLLREAARRRTYKSDLVALDRRSGDTMLQERGRLRDSERDYYLGKLNSKNSRKNAKLSARTSVANSKRTAASSAASRAQSHRQFDLTHNRKGQSKGTASHGSEDKKKPGGSGHALHISQMASALRLTPSGKLKKWSRGETLAHLQRQSTTYTKQEARKALKHFRKQQVGRTQNATRRAIRRAARQS